MNEKKKQLEALNELNILNMDMPSDRLNPQVGTSDYIPVEKNPYAGWSDAEIMEEEKRVNRHLTNSVMGMVNPGNDVLDIMMTSTEYIQGKADKEDVLFSLANLIPLATFGRAKNLKKMNKLKEMKEYSRAFDEVPGPDEAIFHKSSKADNLGGGKGILDEQPEIQKLYREIEGEEILTSESDIVRDINKRNKKSAANLESDRIAREEAANLSGDTENINRIQKEHKQMKRHEWTKQRDELQAIVEANPDKGLEVLYDDAGWPYLRETTSKVTEPPGFWSKTGEKIGEGYDWLGGYTWASDNPWQWIPSYGAIGGGTYLGARGVYDWAVSPSKELDYGDGFTDEVGNVLYDSAFVRGKKK
jgi:hypothetical protein